MEKSSFRLFTVVYVIALTEPGHSVNIITNSGTTLCAQCPERKSELRV